MQHGKERKKERKKEKKEGGGGHCKTVNTISVVTVQRKFCKHSAIWGGGTTTTTTHHFILS
jgi:hypothetical protein